MTYNDIYRARIQKYEKEIFLYKNMLLFVTFIKK